ncbi:MAG: hypothetical protein JNK21_04285 [Rhodospirillaceae bacterium]|nr:hypothetical protein [Rhodospirillaceae bacterium]
MKRENLYFVGAALLASTSLSTFAEAAVPALRAAPGAAGTAVAARPLSAQVFAATPATTTTLGPASLFVRFNQSISSKFTLTVNVTNAKFVATAGQVGANAVNFEVSSGATTNTILAINATSLCTVTPATEKVFLDCDPTGAGVGSVAAASLNGVLISNVTFDNATALATAGTSVTLDGSISVGGAVFETITSTNVITSRISINNNGAAASTSAATGSIDVNASTPFTASTVGGLSIVIGTIDLSPNASVGTDLFTTMQATGIIGAAEAKLTTAFLTDDAFTEVKIIGGTTTLTRGLTQVSSGAVTFALTNATYNEDYNVRVQFNGTKEIDVTSAGSVAYTFTAATATSSTNGSAPVLGNSAVAGISRNSGFTININGIQPNTAQGGSTGQYQSLLRIANTGTTAGTVQVVLRNENSGATLGTYTSPTIQPGSSLQLTSGALESGAGVTPVASVLYQATVTGSIGGYVQHVNWNPSAGIFTDLSGRRNSVNGTNQ